MSLTAPQWAGAITAIMRNLIPQADLSTSSAGQPGRFTIRMPRTSAAHLGLEGDRGRDFLASYLRRHLGAASVEVTSVETTRKTVRTFGTALVTVQVGDPE